MWTFCAGCDIIIKIQIYMLKSGTPNTIGTSNKVNEVCYMIGFNTPSYFAKCFQKQFGVLPKDFIK